MHTKMLSRGISALMAYCKNGTNTKNIIAGGKRRFSPICFHTKSTDWGCEAVQERHCVLSENFSFSYRLKTKTLFDTNIIHYMQKKQNLIRMWTIFQELCLRCPSASPLKHTISFKNIWHDWSPLISVRLQLNVTQFMFVAVGFGSAAKL